MGSLWNDIKNSLDNVEQEFEESNPLDTVIPEGDEEQDAENLMSIMAEPPNGDLKEETSLLSRTYKGYDIGTKQMDSTEFDNSYVDAGSRVSMLNYYTYYGVVEGTSGNDEIIGNDRLHVGLGDDFKPAYLNSGPEKVMTLSLAIMPVTMLVAVMVILISI
ncbi:MAG: hypothetical protein QNJ65_08185 [Xenococcaceae cyanobacterium MO_234.B1]|nr:hypothetical protein [Xenococcaceae cyanobacterium MO_234.B1]